MILGILTEADYGMSNVFAIQCREDSQNGVVTTFVWDRSEYLEEV